MGEKLGKILIIDDDADFSEPLRVALESAGHEVFLAAEGGVGIALARRERPEVIVVDLLMGPEDGFAACAELRSRPETQRAALLVVSAIGQKMHKTLASPEVGGRLDVDGYLDKPIDMESFLSTVGEMLQLARSRTNESGEKR